jgi:hypothetical protein
VIFPGRPRGRPARAVGLDDPGGGPLFSQFLPVKFPKWLMLADAGVGYFLPERRVTGGTLSHSVSSDDQGPHVPMMSVEASGTLSSNLSTLSSHEH